MKKIIKFMIILVSLIFALSYTAFSEEEMIYDPYGLLTMEEKSAMENRLNNLSEKLDFDIMIFTHGEDENALDKFVSDNGYETYDGVILSFNKETGECFIKPLGTGKEILSDTESEEISSEISEYFEKGKVYEGFNLYIRRVQKLAEQAGKNENGKLPSGQQDSSGIKIIITAVSLIAGMFVAMGVTNSMKKTMERQIMGEEDFSGLNIEVLDKKDIYLYSSDEDI